MKRFKYDAPDKFNLYCMGDLHVGNAAFAEDKFKSAVQRVKRDQKGIVLLGGDLCESIHVGDKRYSPEIHAGKFGRVNEQARHVASLLSPIKDKIVGIMDGNHEMKLHEIVDVGDIICSNLGIDIPHSAFTMKIDFGRFKGFFIHGRGMVNSQAGDRKQVEVNDGIRIKRKLRHLAGDCLINGMFHIHKGRVSHPEPYLSIIDGEDGDLKGVYPTIASTPEGVIPEDYRWYFSAPSFLKGFMDDITTYSEAAMYPPSELGFIKVVCDEDITVQKVIL